MLIPEIKLLRLDQLQMQEQTEKPILIYLQLMHHQHLKPRTYLLLQAVLPAQLQGLKLNAETVRNKHVSTIVDFKPIILFFRTTTGQVTLEN